MQAIREGLGSVVPLPMLELMTPEQLKLLVCGVEKFDLELLKRHTDFSDLRDARHEQWLWSALESFTADEVGDFLRFVWGRSWLPEAALFDEMFKVDNVGGGDDRLPSAHTCFFQLHVPMYSSAEVLRERLRCVRSFVLMRKLMRHALPLGRSKPHTRANKKQDRACALV